MNSSYANILFACFVLAFIASVNPAHAQRVLGVRGTDSGGPLMPEQAAYDVTYYDLELEVNPAAKTIEGGLLVHADIVHPTEVLVLHLDSLLEVREVHLEGEDGRWDDARFGHADALLRIDLVMTRQPGDRVKAKVHYGGAPRVAPRAPWVGGFVWDETADGSPWIATAVQGDGADVWWPCKDHPSDEPDSMAISVTVPQPLVVASNGKLRGVAEREDGKRTFNWFVSTPINNYGVAINIAPYRTIESLYTSTAGQTVPVTFWVTPENYEKGQALFPEFLEHLAFYERLLGPYPFRADKYGVAETPHLGMEHQTIIAYGHDYSKNDWGFDWLHHHELGHEWWGNLVTALDWRDFWIHEGFCSYMQALYAEELHGRDAYHASMDGGRANIRNRQPVAPRESRTEGQMYLLAPDYVESDGDIYNKGRWVLHTLRYLIGEEAFFRSLRRMAYPNPEMEQVTDGSHTRFATTDDFKYIAERESGVELDWFFEMYLRQPHLPRLMSEPVEGGMRVWWETPDNMPFPMPVEVSANGEVRRVNVSREPVQLPIAEAAGDVALDPKNWILMEE
ncbi:MAG: M1 family metallopeptidase [Rhodothermia bacterium]|nr:M1 family metallopeptidase [Rhodothermia bacterium]